MSHPSPLVWPTEMWPDIDRLLWNEGTDFNDPFADSHARGLAPITISNAKKAHGRFLAVLAEADVLDRSVRPAVRLTRGNATLFVRALLASGNSHNTISARIQALYCAARILEPGVECKWLIDGQSMLTIQRRDIVVYDGGDLYLWGQELMDRALASPDPAYRQIWFRNGLMITIFATSAPRFRAFCNMRLGKHVRQMAGGAWELWFYERDTKTERLMDYALHESLWPRVDRYVGHERQELLNGKVSDYFWVGRFGERLGSRGIEGMIRRASQKKFGRAFGTHRFRHSLATTQALREPDNPGLAASILGISEGVLAEHYNKARNLRTFERFQAEIQTARLHVAAPTDAADDDDIIDHLLGLSEG